MAQTGHPAHAPAAQARPQADTPPTPSPPAGPFVVRIVDLDYQMVRPVPGLDVCYSSLAGEAVDRVPVVRIFGATPAGQKTCIHLHRVSGRLCRSPKAFIPWPQLVLHRARRRAHAAGSHPLITLLSPF